MLGSQFQVASARRAFLRFLAASPLLALAEPLEFAIKSPEEALNVFDFELAAQKALPPAHFGNLTSGVVGDVTLRANSEAFRDIQLRPRRFVDRREIHTGTQVFGSKWSVPFYLCPCGQQKSYNPEGELAVARAAKKLDVQMALSTVTTCSVEDVAVQSGRPVWYQLYATSRWEVTEKLVRRAEAAGCPAILLTVDLNGGRSSETFDRLKKLDPRPCAACHGKEPTAFFKRKPMFDGIDMTGVTLHNPGLDVQFLARLRKFTNKKLVIKGIVTAEDARICVEQGADGIVVSNHGGRAEESNRATIECLPEVLDAVNGRMPVFIDSGFRRGTDIIKALAMGAAAVGIGRPYLWGLAAFGQPGVERVIDLIHQEFRLIMAQCGTTTINAVNSSLVMRRR